MLPPSCGDARSLTACDERLSGGIANFRQGVRRSSATAFASSFPNRGIWRSGSKDFEGGKDATDRPATSSDRTTASELHERSDSHHRELYSARVRCRRSSMDVQKAVHAEFRRHGLALRRESVRLVADYVRENALPVGDVALLVLDSLDKRQRAPHPPTPAATPQRARSNR